MQIVVTFLWAWSAAADEANNIWMSLQHFHHLQLLHADDHDADAYYDDNYDTGSVIDDAYDYDHDHDHDHDHNHDDDHDHDHNHDHDCYHDEKHDWFISICFIRVTMFMICHDHLG